MSDSSSNFSFPHRTPVFTAIIVLISFALFAWLANRIYRPHAFTVDKVEGVKTPADRKALLEEHRVKERTESTSYGWIDQKAGIVRIPIDRAMELVVREHAKK
ncbi:MAG TPA: hypothetical protein VGM64_14390 [Lacunisphaera sp.]|jgi:hypothetical protein